jgi:hypothetical protein
MARAGVFASIAGLAAAAVLAAAPIASAETVAFGPNSQVLPYHRWTVPAQVCEVTFDLYGAEGSGGVGGARVTTTLAVTPGSLYYVIVGSWGIVGTGGYNGGGDASFNGVGGGGATDVRTGPGLADRILVAGGGGGNGGGGSGGRAGGAGGNTALAGADGTGAVGVNPGGAGRGATLFAGGAFGSGGAFGGGAGTAGTLGQGGKGGLGSSAENPAGHGGGGGGGLYGGGGGGGGGALGFDAGAGGGGGGGSSLVGDGTVTTTTGGQGKAVLTYTSSPSCGQGGGGGGGGQPGGGADKTKPKLSRLTFSRYTFAAARFGASVSPDTKAAPKTGTRLSFSLSEPSSVRFTVERKVGGRKLRGRCVNPGRSPHGRKCTRWAAVRGSFSFAGTAGENTLIFRGRVGGKSLKPGDYRLNTKATDNARNASPLKHTGFKVVAP